MTHKNRKKSSIFMFFCTGCSLLRAESFSCSLGILYGGLGISKLQFMIKKIEIKFPATNFFQFQVIKHWIRIRDPDPESGSAIRKNAGSGSVSGSALNQCGSETLARSTQNYRYIIDRNLHSCFLMLTFSKYLQHRSRVQSDTSDLRICQKILCTYPVYLVKTTPRGQKNIAGNLVLWIRICIDLAVLDLNLY